MESGDIKKIMELLHAVKYNVGGHLNYVFFWESLTPISEGGGVIPSYDSDLGKAINKKFGSFNSFKHRF